MTEFILIAAFGCMVWAGAMTVLYSMNVNELTRLKRELADERRFSQESEDIERHYQEKVTNLLERLRMAAPWMLYGDERVEGVEVRNAATD